MPLWEAEKKVLLLVAGPLREGRGKGPGHLGKRTFLETFFPTFQRQLSSRREGGYALMAWPLREELFLRLPFHTQITLLLGKQLQIINLVKQCISPIMEKLFF